MNNKEQNILYGNRDPYLEEGIKVATQLGLGFHFSMIFYFYYLGVNELAIFNVGSVLFYLLASIWVRRKPEYSFSIFIACSLEVIAHSLIGVYFLGIGSGLNLFMWLVVLLISLSSKTSLKLKLKISGLIAFIYLCTVLFGLNTESIYAISQMETAYLMQFSIFSCAFVAVLIAIYYSKIIKRKEDIILREIHHRIFNNVQLLSSFTKIQMFSYKNDELKKGFRGLLNKMEAIKAVHKNVRFQEGVPSVSIESVLTDLSQNKVNIKLSYSEHIAPELNLEDSVPISVIIHELINLYDYEKLNINTSCEEGCVIELNYKDIRETSKNKSHRKELIMDLVEQIKGKIEWKVNSMSNHVRLSFPV